MTKTIYIVIAFFDLLFKAQKKKKKQKDVCFPFTVSERGSHMRREGENTSIVTKLGH